MAKKYFHLQHIRKNENEKNLEKKESYDAVTRIRTWVTAATTQGPNH